MTSVQTAHSFSETRETKFTILANGAAFKTLSDGLYANKIVAVVRELCCNAYDAHVMAGTQNIPFEIHLPTMSDPYFSIQDFGTGLTDFEACGGYEDKIVPAGSLNPDGSVVKNDYVTKEYTGGIYNTFFKSPKADRKDQIGALGLGSKSPLSYTTQFDVISVKNGSKLFFSVYLNDAGEPSIVKLAEHPSTDHSGLKVVMKVRETDIYQFREACSKVLEWFDVPPVIVNAENHASFQIAHRKYLAHNSEWAMGDTFQSYPAPKAIAVMGKIAYPIEHHAVLIADDEHCALLSTPLVMFFENGELDFAASREALSYTNKTLFAISKKLNAVIKDLPSLVQSDIDSCATLWEAKLRWTEVVQQTALRNLSSFIKVKFKDQIIKDNYIELPKEAKGQCFVFTTTGRKSSYVLGYGSHGSRIQAKPDAVIYIDDLDKGMTSRAKNYAKNTGEFVVYAFADSVSTQAFLDTFEGCPIKYTSDLPKPDRVSTKSAPRALNRVLYTGGSGYIANKLTQYQDIVLEDGGLYVPVCRGFPLLNGIATKNLADYTTQASIMGYFSSSQVIYGLTDAQIKRATKDPNHKWVNFFDLIQEEVKDQIATNSVDFLYSCDSKSWRDDHYYACQMFNQIDVDKLAPGHLVSNFVKAINVEVDSSDLSRRSAFIWLADRFKAGLTTQTNSLNRDFKDVLDAYPLFKSLVNYCSTQATTRDLMEYINAIDLYRAAKSSL